MNDQYKNMYLDYLNNFLTVCAFAEHYMLEHEKAVRILSIGRKIHQGEAS